MKKVTEIKTHSGNLELLGGKICLDFINTLDWRGRENPVEYLNNYEDVIRWFDYLEITNEKETRIYRRLTKKTPAIAREALVYTIELRELLHRVFHATSHQQRPLKKDFESFNAYLKSAMTAASIEMNDAGFILDCRPDTSTLIGILNPVIWDATNVLTSNDCKRVKSCANKECGWFFFDTSKNSSRQWCDMKSCGNRAKARTFYLKKGGT